MIPSVCVCSFLCGHFKYSTNTIIALRFHRTTETKAVKIKTNTGRLNTGFVCNPPHYSNLEPQLLLCEFICQGEINAFTVTNKQRIVDLEYMKLKLVSRKNKLQHLLNCVQLLFAIGLHVTLLDLDSLQ